MENFSLCKIFTAILLQIVTAVFVAWLEPWMELCVFYRCQMFLTQLYIHKANKMCKAVENSSCQVNINHSEPRSK